MVQDFFREILLSETGGPGGESLDDVHQSTAAKDAKAKGRIARL
jgi:hypothetical protein